MTPAEHNFNRIVRGSTFHRKFTWKADGVPVDLTGAVLKMQVRFTAEHNAVLFEQILPHDGAAGVFYVTMAPADTLKLTETKAVYDILIVQGGTVDYILRGTLNMLGRVTHQ